jgi:hypothetical protein
MSIRLIVQEPNFPVFFWRVMGRGASVSDLLELAKVTLTRAKTVGEPHLEHPSVRSRTLRWA